MRRPRFLLLLLGLLGGALAFYALSTRPPPPPPPQSLHLVIAVQGQLRVKREGWTEYAPALFGTVLRRGDLLRLEDGDQATVVCADLTPVPIQPGVTGVPCEAARPILLYKESPINIPRDIPPGEFPMIIAPRNTKLLTTHPMLRWTPVRGVITYQVSIRDWSTTVISATQVAYPADAPPLATGETYKMVVRAGGRNSDEETTLGLGFALLNPDEAQAVREAERRIGALGLDAPAVDFLMAHLYAAQGLNAEAIEQLEALSTTPREPAVARLLGDIYLQIGLSSLAEGQYQQAAQLSEQVGDLEGQALAYHALGRIYEALGSRIDAAQQYGRAMELYRKLGAKQMVEQLLTPLAELKEP